MTTYLSEHEIQRFKQIQPVLDRLDAESKSMALSVPGSPEPGNSIIVFPGSFNPPTLAHLALLEQARQFAVQHGLGQIYAALSRHIIDKEAVQRPLLLDRIILLEEVLQHYVPGTGILLLNRGLYVEQAEGIHNSFAGVKSVYFLIGFDKIVQILDPRYYTDRNAALRELFVLAQLLVAPRGNAGAEELRELLNRPENRQFAQYIHPLALDSAYREMSSTSVREGRDAEGREVPAEVRRFIQETQVYTPPQRRGDGTVLDAYDERVKAIQALLRRT